MKGGRGEKGARVPGSSDGSRCRRYCSERAHLARCLCQVEATRGAQITLWGWTRKASSARPCCARSQPERTRAQAPSFRLFCKGESLHF